jgi:hypothetical protein
MCSILSLFHSLEPTGNNDLSVREEVDGVLPLAMKNAEDGISNAAEGKVGNWGRDTDVDTDIAILHPVG